MSKNEDFLTIFEAAGIIGIGQTAMRRHIVTRVNTSTTATGRGRLSRRRFKRFKLDTAQATEDIPSLDIPLVEFLKLAFRPGETICITKTAELREAIHPGL